jgi:hypothetical protein
LNRLFDRESPARQVIAKPTCETCNLDGIRPEVKATPSQFLRPRVLSKQPVRCVRITRHVHRFRYCKGKGQRHK